MAITGPAITLRNARLQVLLTGLIATAAKIAVAASTHGTGDVRTFEEFAHTIAAVGPVSVYGAAHAGPMVYNHGPLTGILLDMMAHLKAVGAPMPLLVRLPACGADLMTCLLVLDLTRDRMGIRRARWCAIVVALSPVLVAVSGFHGNTDPVFVGLTLLSAWLLARRRSPLWGGVALGLALSVKLVPVVAAPALLLAAFRLCGRGGYRFGVGLAAALTALWAGPLLRYPAQVRADVLDYAGVLYRPWGVPKFVALLELPPHWLALLVGPGRFAVVLLAAVAGLWVAWREPQEAGAAAGLSLAVMLLLSTASAAQYLAWAAAGTAIADLYGGLAYNLVAGLFLTELYSRWSGGGLWDYARATHWTLLELRWSATAWGTLAVAVLLGFRSVLKQPVTAPAPAFDDAIANASQPVGSR
ncbi:glycosyltransferase 87 family protein [Streptacidiphilus carbonis]|jgi:hypothetical protein|uniref:glycosyltransferase 87 family protein n=1 Tax=Streptacidiphilus carbonis TaxID=105422 RepID=UPI000694E1D1|nr:glycosyltransferase 87 family protein [Streptacidiphilus carbonis]